MAETRRYPLNIPGSFAVVAASNASHTCSILAASKLAAAPLLDRRRADCSCWGPSFVAGDTFTQSNRNIQMVKVGIPTVMKALSYVGPRRENAVSCIAARYLASGLPRADSGGVFPRAAAVISRSL